MLISQVHDSFDWGILLNHQPVTLKTNMESIWTIKIRASSLDLVWISCFDPDWDSIQSLSSTFSGWWFQPIWKILVQNGKLPQVGMNIKNIWNHQPDTNQFLFFLLHFPYSNRIHGAESFFFAAFDPLSDPAVPLDPSVLKSSMSRDWGSLANPEKSHHPKARSQGPLWIMDDDHHHFYIVLPLLLVGPSMSKYPNHFFSQQKMLGTTVTGRNTLAKTAKQIRVSVDRKRWISARLM